jgi:FMN phosphatase YigB (HAD superfamily)
MIKAIIFDCFGVVYEDVFPYYYKKFGGDLVADKEYIENLIFGVSSGEVIDFYEQLTDHLGITVDQWRAEAVGTGKFNEPLFIYIDELRKTHKVSMLSNVGEDGLKSYMDTAVLDQHFDDVVESAKIGFAKPEARAFEIAADRLGVRLDECVFIDDRESYCEGATHVGMKAIVYKDVESLKKDLDAFLA